MKKYYCFGKKDFCDRDSAKDCGDCEHFDGSGGEEREDEDIQIFTEEKMSKEKQIDEMVKAVCENYGSCSKCSISNGDYDKTCSFYEDCQALYTAGYRLASDVAREIFEEIETSLQIADFKGGEVYYAIRADDYLHYKKKYIGEDTNVLTNTEGEG
jgi:hypothetical protein